MAQHNKLNSVIHSTAHHAVSSLSYVHPHLGDECENACINSIEIDILKNNICPKQFRKNKPLVLSLNGFKEKFLHILESEGFRITDVSDVILTFVFDFKHSDHYCSTCKVRLVSSKGRVYEQAVNYMGDRVST